MERTSSKHEDYVRNRVLGDAWYAAIDPAGQSSLKPAELRAVFAELAGRAEQLVAEDSLNRLQAQAIGRRLVELNLTQPKVLGQTVEFLGRALNTSPRRQATSGFAARVTAFLGEVATGFYAAARESILGQQNLLHTAFVTVQKQLRQDLHRQQMELVKTNELLQKEIEEREQAEHALRRRSMQLETLHDIERGILEAQSPQAIARVATSFIEKALGCESVGVFRFDPEKRVMSYLAGRNTSGAALEGFNFGNNVVEQKLAEGEIVLVDDLRLLPAPPVLLQHVINRGVRTLLVLPLIAQGELIGSMGLTAKTAGAFSEEDQSFTQQIAASLALAIHDAELLQTEQQLRKQAETLREVANSLNASLNRRQLLEMILSHLGIVLPYTSALIILRKHEQLELVAQRGVQPETAEAFAESMHNLQSIADVWQEQKPRIVSDTALDPDWIKFPGTEYVRCWLGVPLVVKGKTIGLLELSKSEPHFYTPKNAQLALSFANQAAVAIENARLYERLQEDAARLEERVQERTRDLSTLYDTTAITSRYLDLQTILDQALGRLLTALDCSAGAMLLVDEETQQLHLHSHRGLSARFASWLNEQDLQDLSGQLSRQPKPILIMDADGDRRFASVTGLLPDAQYAAVPMQAKGEVTGLVAVFSGRDKAISAEDLALLGSVADHVAVAVENVRLRHKLQHLAVLQERERLARDLHDSATQSLFSLTLFAAAARELVKRGQLALAQQHLEDIATTANQTHKEMRLLLYELRSSELLEEGLELALRNRLEAVEGRAGTQGIIEVAALPALAPWAQENLYHIAHEALNNTLKHGQASTVRIALRVEDEELVMEIVDDGRGFEANEPNKQGHLGLSNMYERAQSLGGKLDVQSNAGTGTRILLRAPVRVMQKETQTYG